MKNLPIYADNGLTLTIHACITSWQNHSPWYTWHKAFSTRKLQLIQGAFYTIVRRSCYLKRSVMLSISAFFIPHTPYRFLISITDFSFSFWFLTSHCSMRWVQIIWQEKIQSNLQETWEWLTTPLLFTMELPKVRLAHLIWDWSDLPPERIPTICFKHKLHFLSLLSLNVIT